MACTAFPQPAVGLLFTIDQGVWAQANQTKGGRSVTYGTNSLTATGAGPGASVSVSVPTGHVGRHKFFGTGNYLAVCVTDTSLGAMSHAVTLIDFTSSPWAAVPLFTTSSGMAPPLPFLQYDLVGSVCCAGGSSGVSYRGLAIYRSDTGAPICAYAGGDYVATGQIIGEVVPGGVQIKDGGTVIAGPCPLPAGRLTISPTSQTFTPVPIGGCPPPPSTKTFTLKNTGDDCLTVTKINDFGPFKMTGTSLPLPATLGKSETLTATVTFAPSATGSFLNDHLAVTRVPALGDDHLTCSGTAAAANAGLTVIPSSVAFGRLPVGTTSPTRPVTITNSGEIPLTVSVGGSGPPFSWTGVNTTLTCKAAATITTTFSPVNEGPATAILTVTPSTGNPFTVSLTGEGCVPRAKISPPPTPFPDFGEVRQAYRMPRIIAVGNPGDGTLTFTASISGPDAALFGLMTDSGSITDVLSSRTFSVNPPSRCGNGPTGSGSAVVAVVFHADAAPPHAATATLTIDAHNDPTAPASFAYPLKASVVAGNTVDAVAVFDTSGSMAEAVQGGTSKMAAAIQAGRLLVSLIPPDLGNRVAGVRFSTDSTSFLGMAEVTGAGQQAQIGAIADPPLTPAGATAIAAGAMTGAKEFLVAHAGGATPQNLTRAMIVVTDGKDNTAFRNPDDGKLYSILGQPAYDPVNPLITVTTNAYAPPTDVKVFAVGLGTDQDVDKNQLATLASGAGGAWQALDPTKPATTFQLMKYYTQIYMDMVDTQAITDPRALIDEGQQHVIEFDVLRGDVSGLVVMYDLDGLRLPFWLESPSGETVDARSVPSGFQLRSGATEQSRFLDFRFPWADDRRYAGRWKLVVAHRGFACQGNPVERPRDGLGFLPTRCAEHHEPVEYGFAIGVGSNFRLQAYVTPAAVKTGQPILLTGIPSEAGLMTTGCTVTVDATAPDGQVWPGIVLLDDGAHDDGAADDGEYARIFTQTATAGTYSFLFRVTGYSRNGEPVRRETVRSKYVQGWADVPHGDGVVPRGDGVGMDPACCKKIVGQLEKENRALQELVRLAKREKD